MKCSRCESSDALFKFVLLPKGAPEPEEVPLCQSCAAEASPYIANMVQKKPVSELLAQLLKQQSSKEAAAPVSAAAADVPPCRECGLPFSTYKATLMLGCPACYESFGEALMDDIRKFHGAVVTAEAPPPPPELLLDRQKRLAAMKAEMAECLENEDYERAAFLRDSIKTLIAEMEASGEPGGNP